MPLTPVAGLEGEVVARNLLEGNQRMPNYSRVPTVAFTIPPIASVGLQEEAVKRERPAVQGELPGHYGLVFQS